MSAEETINHCTQRVQQLSMLVQHSASAYNQKDVDLKNHLNQHNILVGQLSEAQAILDIFKNPKDAVDPVPPVEPVPELEDAQE